MLTAREDSPWSDNSRWEKPRAHGCRALRRLAPACARRAPPPLLAAPKPARVVPFYSGANNGRLALTYRSQRHPIELVVPPASDNRTLQAQEGLFMWKPISMEEIGDHTRKYEVHDVFETILSAEGTGCSVKKILLNTNEATMLLHKVIKLGYDSGRLFPTFERAVRAVKESMSARIGPRW